MNKDIIAGNWKQLRGKVQQRWGKLTNDDLDVIAGKKEQLVGKIQEHYGEAKEDVERDVDAMWDSGTTSSSPSKLFGRRCGAQPH
ncbi:MAG: CsbD family protein [Gemmatimonadetes bacterium]|nr:CsbD family protein [Gemmatimonadota bacterium]